MGFIGDHGAVVGVHVSRDAELGVDRLRHTATATAMVTATATVKARQWRQPLRRGHDQLCPSRFYEAASPSTVTEWMVNPCRFRSTDLMRDQPDGLTVLVCRTGRVVVCRGCCPGPPRSPIAV